MASSVSAAAAIVSPLRTQQAEPRLPAGRVWLGPPGDDGSVGVREPPLQVAGRPFDPRGIRGETDVVGRCDRPDASDDDAGVLERGRSPGQITSHGASEQPRDRFPGCHHERRTERHKCEEGDQREAHRIVAHRMAFDQREPHQNDRPRRHDCDARGAALVVEGLEHRGPMAEEVNPADVGRRPHLGSSVGALGVRDKGSSA